MDNEFIELLDEDQILCLKLYELGLDFGNDVPITLDHVFELGFGEYKLKHLLEKMSFDLYSQKFEEQSQIILDREYLLFKSVNSAELKKLRYEYAKESVHFEIFNFLMFGKVVESRRHFLERVHISRSYFYRISAEVNHILKKNFHFDKRASELETRAIIFNTNYFFFSGIEFPFGGEASRVNELMMKLRQMFLTQLSPTKIEQLRYVLAIQELRIHESVKLDLDIVVPDNKFLQATQMILKGTYHLDEKCSVQESEFLVGFMAINELIKFTMSQFSEVLQQRAIKLTALELPVVTAEVGSDFNIKKLESNFNKINLRTLFPFFNGTTFLRHNDEDFFKKIYPGVNGVALRLIKVIEEKEEIKLSPQNVTQIYYYFMFSIIETIPATAFKNTVYIAVDFSQGELYTEYVRRRLLNLSSLNIVVDKTVFSRTDLYVSDSYMSNIYLPQIIWQNPEREADWKQLFDKIIEIKNKKYQERNTIVETEIE